MQHIIEKYQKEVEVKKEILENLKANAEIIEKFANELKKISFPIKKDGGLKKKAEKILYDFLEGLNQNPRYIYKWGSNYITGNFPANLFYVAIYYRPEPNNFTYTIIEVERKDGEVTVKNRIPELIAKLEQETDPKTVERNIETFKEIYEKIENLPYILRKSLW